MARRLSKKEKGFIGDIADGVTGVQAALNNYDTKSYGTAAVIASENLTKPKIIDALTELGFDENNAKRVVAEILNDKGEEPTARLSAADKVFKVFGSYAAEKSFNVNMNTNADELTNVIKDGLSKFRSK